MSNQYKNSRADAMLYDLKWSEQEEIKFLYLHSQCGNQWISLSKSLTGKTDNDVKNHYYSLLKKQINKIEASNFEFDSELGLIHAIYFTQNLESHFSQKNKPTKDYLNTLVVLKKVSHDIVRQYLKNLNVLFPALCEKDLPMYLYEAQEKGISKFDFLNASDRRLYIPCLSAQQGVTLAPEDKVLFISCWMTQLRKLG
jgi:hypothetical protein